MPAHAVLAQYWPSRGAVYKTLTLFDPNHQAVKLSVHYQCFPCLRCWHNIRPALGQRHAVSAGYVVCNEKREDKYASLGKPRQTRQKETSFDIRQNLTGEERSSWTAFFACGRWDREATRIKNRRKYGINSMYIMWNPLHLAHAVSDKEIYFSAGSFAGNTIVWRLNNSQKRYFLGFQIHRQRDNLWPRMRHSRPICSCKYLWILW